MKDKEILDKICDIFAQIKINSPLVHQITNYVSANDQANITLALGARPVMAEYIEEIHEIITQADALLLNIGTLNDKKYEVILKAANLAGEIGLPVVLDPVGIGGSSFRRDLVYDLLKIGCIDIIKGNVGEILTLIKDGFNDNDISGVDYISDEDYIDNKFLMNIKKMAEKYKCTFSVTGKKDIVTDGSEIVLINNGVVELNTITGSGCMTGSLIASFLARVNNPLMASIAGISLIGIAGQLAVEKSFGPGTFRIKLIDEIYKLNDSKIRKYIDLNFLK
ncbi:MAG: hydroxyethylthiazole kinase [Halanaerobiaceae bacterium]